MRFGIVGPEERDFVRLAARLPDATPDDLSLERVWRRLQMPDPGPARLWNWKVWTSAVALSLAVLGSAAWRLAAAQAPPAELLLSEGGVFLLARGGSWVPARGGDSLRAGTLLRSDTAGRMVVREPGVAALLLGGASDLAVERFGRSTVLRLVGGSVTLRVTKRPREHPFVVNVGEFAVTVVGTTFAVAREPSGDVDVSVSEGVVEVAGWGQHWRVEAGHRWSSKNPGEQGAASIPEPRRAMLAAALVEPPSRELPALLEAMTTAELASSMPPDTGGRESAVLQAPPNVVSPERAMGSAGRVDRATVNRLPSALVRVDPTPPPAILPPAPAPVAPPAPTRDLYAEALNLARHGEQRKAAAILEQALAASEGPRDRELYQLALLRLRHLDDPQGALSALRRYRIQFPNGALRQEVDLSLVQVQVALGHADDALAESARFLSAYPQSERTDEMHALRGDLSRDHGDFAAAAREYQSVGGGPALDDALYYLAYCRRQLGDQSAAARALRDYVGRLPNGRHIDSARELLGQ
jgi:ferric-dicitrate binding protein FerR (iron transport regulator)/TolA-binding protein